jgi:hypothetical protein
VELAKVYLNLAILASAACFVLLGIFGFCQYVTVGN